MTGRREDVVQPPSDVTMSEGIGDSTLGGGPTLDEIGRKVGLVCEWRAGARAVGFVWASGRVTHTLRAFRCRVGVDRSGPRPPCAVPDGGTASFAQLACVQQRARACLVQRGFGRLCRS